MTVEELHDALTLLPAELVAEADRKRNRKPLVIPWRKVVSMAACLAVILGCSFWLWLIGTPMGSSKGNRVEIASAAADAATPEEAPREQVLQAAPAAQANERMAAGAAADQGVYAPGILNIIWAETECEGRLPGEGTAVLVSSEEALEAYRKSCEDQGITGLREATAGYDEGWFENYDLVLLPVVCGADASVASVQEMEGQWEITLSTWQVSLLRNYHILMETEKGAMENADQVTVIYGEA